MIFNTWKLTRNWTSGEVTHSVNSNLSHKLTGVTFNLPASGLKPASGTSHRSALLAKLRGPG
jgi:hypothetical protein